MLDEIIKFKEVLKKGNIELEYYVMEKKFLKKKLNYLYDTYLYNAKTLLYKNIISSEQYNNYLNKLEATRDYYRYLLTTF